MSGPEPRGPAYNVPVAPIRPPGSRRAIVVILVLVGGLGSAVGLGLLSSRAGPVPTEAPRSTRPPAPAATAVRGAVASPTPPQPSSPVPPNPPSVLPFTADGYEVVDLPPALRSSVTETAQRVVTFRAGSSPSGSIVVAAGTPAAGPFVADATHPLQLEGQTLPDLESAYRSRFGPVQSSSDAVVDGQPARILVIQPLAGLAPPAAGWHAVALVAAGLRTFVIDASGFGNITDSRAPDEIEVLQTFLASLHFAGPDLFASVELGFQVDLPAANPPIGGFNGAPGQASGLFVFNDGSLAGSGTWSHRIGVAVGTKADPAQAFILPLLSDTPAYAWVWGPSLASLQKAYLAALGDDTAKVTNLVFKGQPAVEITANSGPAIALLTVHGGRVYIISSTGYESAQVAPDYEQFLASFAFID